MVRRMFFRVDKPGIRLGEVKGPNPFRTANQGLVQTMEAAMAIGPGAVQSLLLSDRWFSLRQGQTTCAPTILIEIVYEQVRIEIDPALPSRWDCHYLFDALTFARRFRDERRPGYAIYSCECEGPALCFDMATVSKGLSDLVHLSLELDQLRVRAITYWGGLVKPTFPEILATGRVTYGHPVEP